MVTGIFFANKVINLPGMLDDMISGQCVFKLNIPTLFLYLFSAIYITINHQPYITHLFFFQKCFVYYFCPFLSTKLFLHNYNVMTGSEM